MPDDVRLLSKLFGGFSARSEMFLGKIARKESRASRLRLIRERGIPERINRTALGAMVAPGPLGNAIVFMLLFPRRPPPPRPVGSDERGLGRKTRGGRSPRGNGQGVAPSNGDDEHAGQL